MKPLPLSILFLTAAFLFSHGAYAQSEGYLKASQYMVAAKGKHMKKQKSGGKKRDVASIKKKAKHHKKKKKHHKA